MAMPPPSAESHSPTRGALADAIVTLAGTPDHASTVDRLLLTIAVLTADQVAAVRYASITALRGRTYTTVAVSDELIRAVDEIQYADSSGPCVEALESGVPVAVPDIAATVQWPRFHEMAPRMGLHASVSVPLYAGRGIPVAVLNVYGNDRAAMAPLIDGICSLHAHLTDDLPDGGEAPGLDEGGRELVAGCAEALGVRATIRLATDMIMASLHCTADDAYLSLCIRAGAVGVDLAGAAATLIAQQRP